MNLLRPAPLVAVAVSAAMSWLATGCSGFGNAADAPVYHCEYGITFTARFIDDTAVLDGARGRDVLHREPGGTTAAQRIYRNPRMTAEFGLGTTGREAILRYPLLPLAARCARD